MTTNPPESDGRRVHLRLLECPARRRNGCGIIDTHLGWMHGLTMTECDLCRSVGGPFSDDSASYRHAYTDSLLASLRARDPSTLLPHVLAPILLKHTDPVDALRLLEEHHPLLGLDLALSVASSLNAPPSLLDLIRSSFMVKPPPPPSPLPRTFVQRVRSYLRSKISRITSGNVPLHILDRRRLSCFGDGQNVAACPSLLKVRGAYFCGSCGCSRTESNRLCGENSKLARHPHLECPRHRPGFSRPNGSYIAPGD